MHKNATVPRRGARRHREKAAAAQAAPDIVKKLSVVDYARPSVYNRRWIILRTGVVSAPRVDTAATVKNTKGETRDHIFMSSKFKRSALGARVPHEKKTSGMATVAMPLPEKIVLPMQQHIGAPCTPTVKKGDAVLVGTVVGAAGGFVGAAEGGYQQLPVRLVGITNITNSRFQR